MAEATDRRERLLWTVAIFAFVTTDAVGFQLRGALLPSIEESFQVSQALLGLVATAGTLGFVASVLVVGLVAGRIDIYRALVGSAAVVAVGAVLTGIAPVFLVFLAALFLRGVATGPFRALDRAVLSHLYPDGRARIFNRYALVWAAGAAAGPLVVTAALAAGNWRFAYGVVAVGFAVSTALLVRLDLPDSVATERELTLDDLRAVLRKPAVAGMTGVLVFNGGIEGTLFTWLPYFAARQLPAAEANLVLSTFLAAYVPGRLAYSYLADRTGRTLDIVLVTLTLTMPALIATIYLASGRWLFVAVFALGLVISATFPTLSAFGMNAAPEYSGPVNAISTSAGYVGIALVPPVVGLLAERVGLRGALGILPALLVAMLVVAVLTRVSQARRGAPT
ncbi:MFS transporter [Halosimplex rubrum]|uniref:MFS transporter n=1 Tax=Halosimplex rubrum TaxID=869889 RepID=A0A7D5SP20_9EURY|nr:MFS transporter [Halosimplex rubrum]QLH76227.1 MFS transporter [Halosimplex rubrum]